jgi:hypothetical protein
MLALLQPGSSEAEAQQMAWQDQVLHLLKKWFTDESVHWQFKTRTILFRPDPRFWPTPKERLQLQIRELTALRRRLDDYDEVAAPMTSAPTPTDPLTRVVRLCERFDRIWQVCSAPSPRRSLPRTVAGGAGEGPGANGVRRTNHGRASRGIPRPRGAHR